MDDTIESFVRGRKQPYKEVQYKEEYKPPVYQDPLQPVYQDPSPEQNTVQDSGSGEPVTVLRHSEQLVDQVEQRPDRPKTRWTASKSRKVMIVNGKTITVPSCLQ